MRLSRLISGIALATMILVSLVGVCKEMLTTCGWDCSAQTMSAVHTQMNMDGCDADASSCAAVASEHMSTFASMYPSVAPSADSLLVLATAFFVAWLFTSSTARSDAEKIRGTYRYLKQRFLQPIAPNFLVVAFRRGILNAKIHASS